MTAYTAMTFCECGRELTGDVCPCGLQWYSTNGTLGACEHYYVQQGEGVMLAALHGEGTVSYYEALIEGVALMHDVSACPV